jgi:L-amino acid N-acyltransferase YncA
LANLKWEMGPALEGLRRSNENPLVIPSKHEVNQLAAWYREPYVMAAHGLAESLPRSCWDFASSGGKTNMGHHFIWRASRQDYHRAQILAHGTINDWMPHPASFELTLTVHKDAWHQGVGHRMVSYLLQKSQDPVFNASRQAPLQYCHVGIVSHNSRSLRMFRGLGFAEVGQMPFYARVEEHDCSRILMVAEVNQILRWAYERCDSSTPAE